MFHPGELPGHTLCRFFMFEKQLFGPLLLFSGAFGLEGCFILLAYKSPLRLNAEGIAAFREKLNECRSMLAKEPTDE